MSESIVRSARSNGLAPEEFQIDFDCAESKLAGYRVWTPNADPLIRYRQPCMEPETGNAQA